MKRLLAKLGSGRGQSDAPQSSAFRTARTLEVAITAATFVRREPNDEGERIAVYCDALGGSFFYSREEAERRVMLYFPALTLDEVAEARRYLEDRLRVYVQPIEAEQRRNTSWVHSWRGEH